MIFLTGLGGERALTTSEEVFEPGVIEALKAIGDRVLSQRMTTGDMVFIGGISERVGLLNGRL